MTQALSRAREAQRVLAKNGVPGLTIREGQHLGVFTDLHSERFGMLAASSPTVRSSDWTIVASQVESLGDRGVEGFLVESNTSTAMLQVHSMRLDSRTGHFTVDQIAGRFNAARKAMSLTAKGRVPGAGPLAALAGTQLGQISVGQAREFDATALFTALPPNAMTTAAGAPVQTFTLNPNFEFEHVQTTGAGTAGRQHHDPAGDSRSRGAQSFLGGDARRTGHVGRCLRSQARRSAGHRLPARAGRHRRPRADRSGE